MIKAIVTDIEGTTSSISFVKKVLFPYAKNALPGYIRTHRDDPEVRKQLNQVAQMNGLDSNDIEAHISTLRNWMREDQKLTPLKTLQGIVWQAGYEHNDYQAHMYSDALQYIQLWNEQGIPLYVYSSGSIKAQQLFFKYSEHGDLTSLFQGHFDTNIGYKQETHSYQKIAKSIDLPAQDILFLSDIEAELDAAKAAGMQTYWLLRPEDSPLNPQQQTGSPHPVASSFADIQF